MRPGWLDCIYAIIEYISKFATIQCAITGGASDCLLIVHPLSDCLLIVHPCTRCLNVCS